MLVLAVSAVTVLGLPDGAPEMACTNGLIPAHTNSTNTANGTRVPFYVNTSNIGDYYIPGRTYRSECALLRYYTFMYILTICLVIVINLIIQ